MIAMKWVNVELSSLVTGDNGVVNLDNVVSLETSSYQGATGTEWAVRARTAGTTTVYIRDGFATQPEAQEAAEDIIRDIVLED